MRILLDMDEVLCDFVGGACRAWGLTVEEVRQHWQVGQWDIVQPLNRILGIGTEDFWQRIDQTHNFWLYLEPLPWMGQVLELVRTVTDDWAIVTSPSRNPLCCAGKMQWLQRHLGSTFRRFVFTGHKEYLVGPNTVLVDDREATVRKFIEAGSDGIVFPAHHNSKYRHMGDPITYLKWQLTYLKWQLDTVVIGMKEQADAPTIQER